MAVKELAAEADGIVEAVKAACQAWNESQSPSGLKSLKQHVSEAQRELRDVKRRLADEERAIRGASQDQRAKVAGQGQLVGLFVSSKARGAIARGRASSRQAIAKREASALQPYRNVKAAIDRQLGQLQTIKEQIDAVATAKAATSSKEPPTPTRRTVPTSVSPPPPPPTPPTWAADPSGRHELRYWNGTAWTEHVSDVGVATTDPI